MTVMNLKLPKAGYVSVPAARLSMKVRYALENIESVMLLPDWEKVIAGSDIKPYNDPILNSRKQRLRLAGRLWQSGMLTTGSVRRGSAAFFSVVHSVEEEHRRPLPIAGPGGHGHGRVGEGVVLLQPLVRVVLQP